MELKVDEEMEPTELSAQELVVSTAWEKTIEYTFLLNVYRGQNIDFVAPFDGDAERAGDGVFSFESLVTLVEFKRARRDFVSERKKFVDWRKACRELHSVNRCHYIVYGSSGTDVKLTAARFFPVRKQAHGKVVEEWTLVDGPAAAIVGQGGGVAPSDFIDYLDRLLQLKRDAQGKSGGKHLLASGVALGLDTTNGELVAIRLQDYLQRLTPAIKERVRFLMSEYERRKSAMALIESAGSDAVQEDHSRSGPTPKG